MIPDHAIARGRTPWRDYTGGDSGDPKASEGGYSALVGAVEKAAAEVVSGEARTARYVCGESRDGGRTYHPAGEAGPVSPGEVLEEVGQLSRHYGRATVVYTPDRAYVVHAGTRVIRWSPEPEHAAPLPEET